MTGRIVYVDRTAYDLGDVGDISTAELRAIANVPDSHDLWRVADWGYREWLKGPMVHDEKADGKRQFFGPVTTIPVRYYTAPKYINGSAPASSPEGSGE